MAVEKKQFYLLFPKEERELASAFTSEVDKLPHELIEYVGGLDLLPFEFRLKRISASKNGISYSNDLTSLKTVWSDYLPNNLAWPIFSLRVKEIINENLSGNEGLEWIKAKINYNNHKKEYYVPRFKFELDVLDTEKTKFVPGTNQIIKPIYSNSKLKKLSVFHEPSSIWQVGLGFYVSEKIKNSLEQDNLTGMTFEEVIVT